MATHIGFINPVQGQWWQSRALLILLVMAAAIPLLVPEVPPLVDLPGHMGRYRVQLGIDESPALARYYAFDWALIGNLGIDLLIVPLEPLLGLELAVKLVVASIPPLTVAGFLAVSQAIHRTVPATVFFALPLAYGYPFHFGFVNFALSAALAFLAFALWLRLGLSGKLALRAALFVPLSILIWVCHIFGWGLLGLLAFATEAANARDRGANYVKALFQGGIACLPLAPPFLLMILWRSGPVAGVTADWFNWQAKGRWLVGLLREYWQGWDIASAILVMLIPLTALFWRKIRFSHKLGLATLLLMLAFIALPRILLGSAYADMRLAPFLFATALLAIAPVGDFARRWSGAIAGAGLAFYGARLAVTTAVFAQISATWDRQLEAVERIAPGSRVLALAANGCNDLWARRRMEHLSSFATIRRDAFANDQWVMPGAQLLRVRYRQGLPYSVDPSQIMRPPQCPSRIEGSVRSALPVLESGAFDYLWLIDVPSARWPDAAFLTPVWRGERRGILYRVGSATSARDTPNGSRIRPTA